MDLPTRPVWAEVHTKAVAHNVRQFKNLVGSSCQLMAVVKANGYGHGALTAARQALAHGATWLAVAFPEEGAALRRAGIASPILVLGGLVQQQLELCVSKDLAVSLFQWDVAAALSVQARRWQKTVRVHVKVDTGMGRLGIHPDEVVSFVRRVKGLPGLEVQGIFTHFASADDQDQYYQWQLQRFQKVLRDLEREGINIPLRHCANTAAALFDRASHLNMVRIGLGLYGLYPNERRPIVLQPALTLKARLVAVRTVPPGTAVGYGSQFVTWKETNIGVLPLGYADGMNRHLGGTSKVLVNGSPCPVVGRICMDHCMVDLGELQADVGSEVVLIGRQGSHSITVDDWAACIGTINYEIPCMLSQRVERCDV